MDISDLTTVPLDQFQIVRELAKGANGKIYLGHRQGCSAEPVVIKLFTVSTQLSIAQQAAARHRFEREVNLLKGFKDHPHIVSYLQSGQTRVHRHRVDLQYIIMEHIAGHSLDYFIQPERLLPVSEVIRLTHQAALTLDALQRLGYLHRDIKPANLLISDDIKVLKLSDFGVAGDIDTINQPASELVGTPFYMSPELFSQRCYHKTHDLYALGIVMYQMLTGHLPFYREDMSSLILEITTGQIRIPDTVDPALAAVILRLTHLQPEQRFQTGAELAETLHQISRELTTRF